MKYMNIRAALISCFLCVFFGFSGQQVFASSVSVAPLLIDEETEARGIISRDITLTNNTQNKLIVYATVNEIAVDNSGEIKEFVSPMSTDRTNTVTSWVEITRGRIELEPGQTTNVPLTLKIHPQAKSGDYHMFIGFAPAAKRHEAEAAAMRGEAEGTIVKLSLKEKSDQLLRISNFDVDRFIVNAESRTIGVEVQNDGETPTTPKGEIIFYSARGEELKAVPVNEENIEIPPGEKRVLYVEVPFGSELGRYKANVNLSYGNQQAAVFDTAQFFMIPLPLMLGIFVGILLFSVIVTYLIRRAFYDELHEDEEHNELPLYVRNDREHQVKDHDIHLTKNK